MSWKTSEEVKWDINMCLFYCRMLIGLYDFLQITQLSGRPLRAHTYAQSDYSPSILLPRENRNNNKAIRTSGGVLILQHSDLRWGFRWRNLKEKRWLRYCFQDLFCQHFTKYICIRFPSFNLILRGFQTDLKYTWLINLLKFYIKYITRLSSRPLRAHT